MLDFFCTYQDIILGFGDNTDLYAAPPWNSPEFMADVPLNGQMQPNSQLPANQQIPENQRMNWANFCWYNYWYSHCVNLNPSPSGPGADAYIPDWSLASPYPDWGYAMIWGKFYLGPPRDIDPNTGLPKDDCNYYWRGSAWDVPGSPWPALAGYYQYVWGKLGGLDLLNEKNGPGLTDFVVRRSRADFGTVALP